MLTIIAPIASYALLLGSCWVQCRRSALCIADGPKHQDAYCNFAAVLEISATKTQKHDVAVTT